MVNSQAYTSQRSFAAAAGVSAPALKKTLGLADCPVNAKPPWTDQDLEILKAYRQHLQEDRAAERNGEKKAAANSQGAPVASPMSAARIVDLKLKTERMLKTRIEREILEGKHVDRARVQHEIKQLIHSAKTAFVNLPKSITPRLDRGAERRVTDRVRQILQELAQGLQRVSDHHG